MPLHLRPWALALLLASSASALAQEDEPIPYGEDEEASPRKKLPPRSEPTRGRSEETDVEKQEREANLALLDDPTIGVGFELLSGLMLIESSRGAVVDPRFGAGANFTWEFGRLFFNEALRDGLFADLRWEWSSLHDGTTAIYEDTHFHYLSIAPAFGVPVMGPDFIVYGQLGGGMVLQQSTLHFGDRSAATTGLKPLIQYGVGIRGKPLVSVDGLLRVAFRVELVRYRRHYMDDTYLGASLGAAF